MNFTAAQSNWSFQPNASQLITLYWILGYAACISILWNIPYILWPFKILTVGLHEFSHAFAGLLTGAKIVSITLDPNEGGLTKMKGGNPYISLPAGYIGSLFWGSCMIFSGFNDTASKVMAIIMCLIMLLTLFYARNMLAISTTILAMALFAILWWFQDSKYLRFYVLFLGVMSSLYSLWDIIEDLIMRKVNESDASQYSRICCNGSLSPKFWGCLWLLISLVIFGLSIALAIYFFKSPN